MIKRNTKCENYLLEIMFGSESLQETINFTSAKVTQTKAGVPPFSQQHLKTWLMSSEIHSQ